MFVVTSLAFHALVNAVAIAIGLSTEARAILNKRSELVLACAREGSDERYAFELANVDRVGVENRLWRAGMMAALVNTIAFFPAQLVAGEFRDAFHWSLETKSRFGSLIGLAVTVVWSGYAVRRKAAQHHWNAA